VTATAGKARQVVIIGAPRSGTNMLRDWLCSVDGVDTWPCDEINAVWRHGNLRHPTDQFTPEMATPAIQRFVRRRFDWVARRYEAHTVVEKTCANSLRVGFVEAVLEQPLYLFIHRDGVDATASTMKRWRSRLDLPYLLRKARFVPPEDLPFLASRYLMARLAQWRSSEHRLATWGPVFPQMHELAARGALDELCARQWQACVLQSLADFQNIPPSRVLQISYDRLVREKDAHADAIANYLGIEARRLRESPFFAAIRPSSVGRARKELPPASLERIESVVAPVARALASAPLPAAVD
jgi:hypothetical protein